jgi:iron complex outermembrane receptor protein
VEVLRGPQGTLNGRNATAGAVNINSAMPTDIFEGELKGETGAYDSRRASGFINLPIDGTKLGLRASGSYTNRNGYEYNSTTGDRVDGRDLYSIRTTLSFRPIDSLRGTLVWEHFDENDNRVRSGKQLCTRDPGLSSIDGIPLSGPIAQAAFSQGCADASLYAPAAFGAPNGLSNPIVVADSILQGLGAADGAYSPLLNGGDPYAGLMQSPSLREIASKLDPHYRARSNIVQLNLDYDVTQTLRLSSQTVVDWDGSYSNQDFDRFDSLPGVFNATSASAGTSQNDGVGGAPANLTDGGVYCDPQLGCSSAIVGEDADNAVSRQVTQEIHLTSSFAGPLNFSLGGDYTSFRALENYYIFFNTMSALAQVGPVFGNDSNRGQYDVCYRGLQEFNVTPSGNLGCIYIDPNALSNINGQGHNYYRSITSYKLDSESVFGEIYYTPIDTVSVITGMRYSNDIKTTTPYPTQTLLSGGFFGGGTVDGGYPALADVKQDFPALTGRFVIAWSPTPAFTDKTLIYASYNRGAKSGGANPPGIGYSTTPLYPGGPALFAPTSYPAQYKPEKVDAFEIGTKNILMGGRLDLNAAAFFYNYKNYQVSQVEQDNVVNENFNADVWGAEWEASFQATRRFRLNASIGHEQSSIERGQQSIDVDNRTQGNADYVVLRPWLQLSDNCVVSKAYAASILNNTAADPNSQVLALIYNGCPGYILGNYPNAATAPASIFPNEGRGFYADLSGHSLPNMPRWTQSISAQYDLDLPEGWRSNFRVDYYHQTNSWARVYQDPIDAIRGWSNVNLRLALTPPRGRMEIEIYCKNLLDTTAITGTFLNSDDRYLTDNVFTTDPRLIGASLSIRF